jgi:hypothetical protein
MKQRKIKKNAKFLIPLLLGAAAVGFLVRYLMKGKGGDNFH